MPSTFLSFHYLLYHCSSTVAETFMTDSVPPVTFLPFSVVTMMCCSSLDAIVVLLEGWSCSAHCGRGCSDHSIAHSRYWRIERACGRKTRKLTTRLAELSCVAYRKRRGGNRLKLKKQKGVSDANLCLVASRRAGRASVSAFG